MHITKTTLFTSLTTLTLASAVVAHDGRRFQIEVVDEGTGPQLRAQGYNSNDRPVDPAGPRPYFNALHDHFQFLGSGVYTKSLPGYDMGQGSDVLAGFDMTWEFVGLSKWEGVDQFIDPANMGRVIGEPVPNLVSLDFDQTIVAGFGGQTVSPGESLLIVDDYDGLTFVDADGKSQPVNAGLGSNGYDVDLSYLYQGPTTSAPNGPVAGTLFVIESRLTTDAPGILDSDSIYTILSPGGNGPVEKLHFASLYLEEFLGTPVPEPTSLALFGVASFGLLRRQRA